MFGRWLARPEAPPLSGAQALNDVVRRELGAADETTVLVVTAMAGLLGTVAYADRSYSEREEARVRRELERVHGMTDAGVAAICAALREHVIEISTVQAPRYSRTLLELGDRELRVEVLEALVELAAADGAISVAETNLLRQVTTALGLSQSDYNAAQSKHRDRIAALKP